MCCGYGPAGVKTVDLGGYDCVMIPGASKAALPAGTPVPNSICGNGVGLVTTGAIGTASATVCSNLKIIFKFHHCDRTYENAKIFFSSQILWSSKD